jgi:hypothetical protein
MAVVVQACLLGSDNDFILMPKNEDILGLILAGGIGYLLGQKSSEEWKPFMDQFRERFEQLTHTKTPLPWAFLKSRPNIQAIYRQSIYCYLFGLPDASLPTLLRVLELSLVSKYETAERKRPPTDMGLARLIDWAETYLKENIKVAHAFRLLRNFVHTDKLIQEQDCLEAIMHISTILEILSPSENITMNVVCHYCHQTGIASVLPGQGYLGNKMNLQCDNCKKSYHWMIMP